MDAQGGVHLPPGVENPAHHYYDQQPQYRTKPHKNKSKSKGKPSRDDPRNGRHSPLTTAMNGNDQPLQLAGLQVFYNSEVGRTCAIIKNTSLLERPETWRELRHVQELYLEDEDTNFRVFPEEFAQLRHLQVISIRWSWVKCLSPHLDGLPITHAYLTHNKLQSVAGIEHFTGLSKLDLSCNCLTSLPESIGHLKSLKKLTINGNKLQKLPDTISQCSSLRELYANSNKLRTLPETLCHIVDLKTLDVSMNQLVGLPGKMNLLKNLVELILSCNKISSLTESLQGCTALRHILVRKNHLRELSSYLGALPCLECINAQDNQLTTVQCHSKSITRLRLENNKIRSIEDAVLRCEKLENLSMSGNQIKQIPTDISKLQSLRSLDLGSNSITSIPKELCDIRQLRHLILNNNKITTLPSEFQFMTKLALLKLEKNNLDVYVQTAYLQGIQSVREMAKLGFQPPPVGPVKETHQPAHKEAHTDKKLHQPAHKEEHQQAPTDPAPLDSTPSSTKSSADSSTKNRPSIKKQKDKDTENPQKTNKDPHSGSNSDSLPGTPRIKHPASIAALRNAQPHLVSNGDSLPGSPRIKHTSNGVSRHSQFRGSGRQNGRQSPAQIYDPIHAFTMDPRRPDRRGIPTYVQSAQTLDRRPGKHDINQNEVDHSNVHNMIHAMNALSHDGNPKRSSFRREGSRSREGREGSRSREGSLSREGSGKRNGVGVPLVQRDLTSSQNNILRDHTQNYSKDKKEKRGSKYNKTKHLSNGVSASTPALYS